VSVFVFEVTTGCKEDRCVVGTDTVQFGREPTLSEELNVSVFMLQLFYTE
jgi:hypothetical protein